MHTYPNIFENGDFFSIYIFKKYESRGSIMDRFSPVQTKVQITIASLIGHALYDVRHHGIFLSFSSVNTSSWQQQMCNVTSGMIAKYVAATTW